VADERACLGHAASVVELLREHVTWMLIGDHGEACHVRGWCYHPFPYKRKNVQRRPVS
jgi:hypothetical protein